MELSTAIEGYLFAVQAENQAPKTLQTARWHLGKFTEWKGNISLEQVCPTDIRGFLIYQQQRGIAPHSVHQYYKIMHGFFNWCRAECIVEHDPFVTIKPPKLPHSCQRCCFSIRLTSC